MYVSFRSCIGVEMGKGIVFWRLPEGIYHLGEDPVHWERWNSSIATVFCHFNHSACVARSVECTGKQDEAFTASTPVSSTIVRV